MPAPFIQSTTQDHLDIEDIKDNFVVLKSGDVAVVLQTTAVNFDLLSEIEQDAIISAFSMLLNSISFPLQIVIRSKKLDITKQAEAYRKFVQEVIKRNEVLDKKFYIVIPSGDTAGKELGKSPFDFITKLFGFSGKRIHVNVNQAIQRAQRELLPKIDHVTKELNRIGVRSRVMATQELVELYFDIYNPSSIHGQRIRTNVADYKTAIVEPAILEE